MNNGKTNNFINFSNIKQMIKLYMFQILSYSRSYVEVILDLYIYTVNIKQLVGRPKKRWRNQLHFEE
jgi:hypothetical protein